MHNTMLTSFAARIIFLSVLFLFLIYSRRLSGFYSWPIHHIIIAASSQYLLFFSYSFAIYTDKIEGEKCQSINWMCTFYIVQNIKLSVLCVQCTMADRQKWAMNNHDQIELNKKIPSKPLIFDCKTDKIITKSSSGSCNSLKWPIVVIEMVCDVRYTIYNLRFELKSKKKKKIISPERNEMVANGKIMMFLLIK